ALKPEHKLDHYGVSDHEPVIALLCLEAGKPEAHDTPISMLNQEWIGEVLGEAARAGVEIIARERLGNGFLTGGIRPDATFPPGDIRHHWPPSMIAGRTAVAERLSFLKKPNRTMTQAALQFVLAFEQTS